MEKQKRALVYDPYIDTLGGGERYTLTACEVLSELGYEVILAWKNVDDLKKASLRFGLNLDQVKVSGSLYSLMSMDSGIISRYQTQHNFDVVFIVSDGSIPIMFGKRKILHFQVPFTKSNSPYLLNRLKLMTIDMVVVNSEFTKKVIAKTFEISSRVVYPPVDLIKSAKEKQNIIISVGRFVSPSHPKKHDALIEAFKRLYDNGCKKWRLVIAGGYRNEAKYLSELRKAAKGYPITLVTNPSRQKLRYLYSIARIYWHAAGLGVDEKLSPEKVEHFGITTVEAMSAGCVPVVINRGGQGEIVTLDSGYLVEDLVELVNKTKTIIDSKNRWKQRSIAAIKRARSFEISNFKNGITHLVS